MLSHRSPALAGKSTSTIVHRRQVHFQRGLFSNWDTKQDPGFLRYQRHRFLNTRAKLMKSIQRRRQWDLSGSFFTPRHIRFASHYYGRHRGFGRWQRDEDNAEGRQEWNQSDGYELSAKEKSWKQQMERMRRRVQDDPYEAVFGRRFEPFWGPLVPSWMRAELKTPEVDAEKTEKKRDSSYAAYSSTSWNSWTNKCKKTEWDTVSGQTKHYEYDPITNRMVQMSGESSSKPLPEQSATQPTSESPSIVESAKPEVRKAIAIPRFAAPAIEESSNPVDNLTARDIRAAMGKNRQQEDAEVNILLSERKTQPAASSHWDHAEQYVALEQEVDGLKAQKDRLLRHERRAFHFADLAKRLETIQARIEATEAKLSNMNAERVSMSSQSTLQPAVDRLQSKPAQRVLDVDDSAAHESTETSSAIPKAWTEQADLLQSDRIKRTADKLPAQPDQSDKLSRANEMLQAEIDRQKLVMKLHEERHKDSVRVLQGELLAAFQSGSKDKPAAEALQAKIDEMQQAEAKYKAKIAALKQELDIAYKQSSRHADEFRDQIKQSEARNLKLTEVEEKYKRKIASLREDLDTAFKQSSEHADEFRDQISKANAVAGEQASMQRFSKAIERKLYKAQIGALKEELDLAYQQSSRRGDEFRRQITALEQKLATAVASPGRQTTTQKEHDRALVREIRSIYENEYGIIGREATLDECLNDYDKARSYKFKHDNLEAELSGQPVKAASEPARKMTPSADVKGEEQLLKAYRANEKKSAYAYKTDDLEAELKQPAQDDLIKDAAGIYHFREDGLEHELKPAVLKAVKDPAYQYRKDDLENELKSCERSTEHKTYAFKQDGLEAELASKHTQPGASASPAELDNKSYAFKKDNLEAELAAQTSAEVTRQNRASLRKRIAEDFKDVAKMLTEVRTGRVDARRNPIDGMTPAVANYASPTGFVRYAEDGTEESGSTQRIRREEPVFSGERRVKLGRRPRSEHDMHRDRHRRRRKTKRFLKLAALIAAITAVVVYVEGAGLEAQETKLRSQLEQQAWTKIAQEYEKSGERGILKAMDEMKTADAKTGSGLFWK